MGYNYRDFLRAADENVKKDFRAGVWRVWDRYDILESEEGVAYIEAAQNADSETAHYDEDPLWENYGVLEREGIAANTKISEHAKAENPGYGGVPAYKEYRPLADIPALFLEFAGLADEEITQEVWSDWVHRYGTLGLGHRNPKNATWLEDPSVCEPGGPGESFVNFRREALRANWLLRLYEAVFTPESPDIDVDWFEQRAAQLWEVGRSRIPLALDTSDPARVTGAAVAKVWGQVRLKLMECYPALYLTSDENRFFALGWDFYSLLGAMYMQMAWLMAAKGEEVRWCKMPGCTRIIAFKEPEKVPTGTKKNDPKKNDRSAGYKTRRDKVFCGPDCRGKYHYHQRVKPGR